MKNIDKETINILSGAVSICIYCGLLNYQYEIEINVEGILESLNAMLNNASKNEEYEFCQEIVKAKKIIEDPQFNIEEFLEEIEKIK